MKLCAAQYAPLGGSIERNVLRHGAFVELAAAHGGELVVFPELSLTGYAPPLAKQEGILMFDTVTQDAPRPTSRPAPEPPLPQAKE